jgi:DNA-binding response OmpR family regulator
LLLQQNATFDLLVLDVMLPGKDGFAVATELRKASHYIPVLMLTARGRPEDVLKGFASGADDYLPKPFDFAELTARVRALGRRSAAALPPILECGDLTLDPNRRAASRAGRRLELSPKEFALLECLLASAGRVVPAEELLERVWDEAADPFTTAVKTTVRRLRGKLGDPPVIHTERGGGYRLGEA